MNPSFDVLRKSYSQLGSDLKAARGMLSLVAGLHEFFREPVTLEKAKEEIRRALETREQRFLDLVKSHVYDREASPYLKLLRLVGCDFGDLQTHVRRHGLEKTLEKLAAAGVYLTQDEFKGKKEVVSRLVAIDGFEGASSALRRFHTELWFPPLMFFFLGALCASVQ